MVYERSHFSHVLSTVTSSAKCSWVSFCCFLGAADALFFPLLVMSFPMDKAVSDLRGFLEAGVGELGAEESSRKERLRLMGGPGGEEEARSEGGVDGALKWDR